MSATLIARSPALQRLQNEGYNLEIRNGSTGAFLLVHDVPYVTPRREVKRGTLVTPLELAGDTAATPVANHQAWFQGEHPCNPDGSEILQIKHSSQPVDYGGGLIVQHSFSAKLRTGNYPDYHAKMTRYIDILSGPARALETEATARTFPPVLEDSQTSVFRYADTATSRAGIGTMSSKLANQKIGIIGLGGTGAYVLDLVAKTHVAEIHLFDGDEFHQHNAFRAPGAAAVEEFGSKKVTYYSDLYGRMRHGLVPHPEYVTEENTDLLKKLDFVFACVDKPQARPTIFATLNAAGVPFIDVGMDVQSTSSGELIGQCRVTLATPSCNAHVNTLVSSSEGRANDLYATDIQVADLNALNATFAVIRWKKFNGFYGDQRREHHSVYIINTHGLTRDVVA